MDTIEEGSGIMEQIRNSTDTINYEPLNRERLEQMMQSMSDISYYYNHHHAIFINAAPENALNTQIEDKASTTVTTTVTTTTTTVISKLPSNLKFKK